VPKFTLDTNVVVDALRVPEQLRGLKAFLQRALPVTYLSAVVLQELEAGVSSARQADLLEEQLVGPFERRGRVFAPTAQAWRRSGSLLGRLQRGQHRPPPSALSNDLLLALSCREQGMTLITRDTDFRRLTPLVPGLQVVLPYPDLPSRVPG